MDFTIKKLDLLAAIDKCSVAVPSDHQQEAFNVMRVEPKKKTVRFAAVGEVCTVDTVVEGEVKSPGHFHVRPKHLRNVAASMPDGKIQFSLKGTRVSVKSLVSSRRASFEGLTVELFSVEDPGKDAPWIEVDAKELQRALLLVKPMSIWEDRPDPAISLLVPTEAGMHVFACNNYLIAKVDTSIRIEGVGPIQLTQQAVEVLTMMTDIDENVRIFSNERRVYLENCDTLISAALPISYPYAATHQRYTDYISGTDGNQRQPGPTFNPALLLSGVKSVLSLAGFASSDERKKPLSVVLRFSDVVQTELALSEADARDEFGVEAVGGDLTATVDSGYLLRMLGSLTSTPVVKAHMTHDGIMVILQSQGLTFGVMTKAQA